MWNIQAVSKLSLFQNVFFPHYKFLNYVHLNNVIIAVVHICSIFHWGLTVEKMEMKNK